MKLKQWWKSKTNWFNFSLGMSWIGIAISYINELGLDPVTAGRVGFTLAMIQSIGNFYLRKITTHAIGTPEPEEFTGE